MPEREKQNNRKTQGIQKRESARWIQPLKGQAQGTETHNTPKKLKEINKTRTLWNATITTRLKPAESKRHLLAITE